MNSALFSFFIRLLIFSIVTFQLTSSASFPNAPQLPSANASAEEWATFMKFLHNYYAIIARPRFGKRSDPSIPALFQRLAASKDFLSENNGDINDEQVNLDDFYRYFGNDRRR